MKKKSKCGVGIEFRIGKKDASGNITWLTDTITNMITDWGFKTLHRNYFCNMTNHVIFGKGNKTLSRTISAKQVENVVFSTNFTSADINNNRVILFDNTSTRIKAYNNDDNNGMSVIVDTSTIHNHYYNAKILNVEINTLDDPIMASVGYEHMQNPNYADYDSDNEKLTVSNSRICVFDEILSNTVTVTELGWSPYLENGIHSKLFGIKMLDTPIVFNNGDIPCVVITLKRIVYGTKSEFDSIPIANHTSGGYSKILVSDIGYTSGSYITEYGITKPPQFGSSVLEMIDPSANIKFACTNSQGMEVPDNTQTEPIDETGMLSKCKYYFGYDKAIDIFNMESSAIVRTTYGLIAIKNGFENTMKLEVSWNIGTPILVNRSVFYYLLTAKQLSEDNTYLLAIRKADEDHNQIITFDKPYPAISQDVNTDKTFGLVELAGDRAMLGIFESVTSNINYRVAQLTDNISSPINSAPNNDIMTANLKDLAGDDTLGDLQEISALGGNYVGAVFSNAFVVFKLNSLYELDYLFTSERTVIAATVDGFESDEKVPMHLAPVQPGYLLLTTPSKALVVKYDDTGTNIWFVYNYDLNGKISMAPFVHKNRILLGAGTSGRYILDRDTFKLVHVDGIIDKYYDIDVIPDVSTMYLKYNENNNGYPACRLEANDTVPITTTVQSEKQLYASNRNVNTGIQVPVVQNDRSIKGAFQTDEGLVVYYSESSISVYDPVKEMSRTKYFSLPINHVEFANYGNPARNGVLILHDNSYRFMDVNNTITSLTLTVLNPIYDFAHNTVTKLLSGTVCGSLIFLSYKLQDGTYGVAISSSLNPYSWSGNIKYSNLTEPTFVASDSDKVVVLGGRNTYAIPAHYSAGTEENISGIDLTDIVLESIAIDNGKLLFKAQTGLFFANISENHWDDSTRLSDYSDISYFVHGDDVIFATNGIVHEYATESGKLIKIGTIYNTGTVYVGRSSDEYRFVLYDDDAVMIFNRLDDGEIDCVQDSALLDLRTFNTLAEIDRIALSAINREYWELVLDNPIPTANMILSNFTVKTKWQRLSV